MKTRLRQTITPLWFHFRSRESHAYNCISTVIMFACLSHVYDSCIYLVQFCMNHDYMRRVLSTNWSPAAVSRPPLAHLLRAESCLSLLLLCSTSSLNHVSGFIIFLSSSPSAPPTSGLPRKHSFLYFLLQFSCIFSCSFIDRAISGQQRSSSFRT